MLENEAGQDAPGVDTEATQTAPATIPAETLTPDTQTEEKSETEPAAEKSFTQAELNEIVQKEKAKAEAKAERRVIKALEKFQPQAQERQQEPVDTRPSRGQYADDETYIDAITDWKLDQREAGQKQAQEQQTQKQHLSKAESIYAEAMKAGIDRDDLNEVADAMPMAMRSAVVDSDIGGKLMAYMAGNPDELARISTLPPARQAAEIGKLELRLQTTKTTKAPAPITPIGSRGSANQPLDQMTFADYKAQRAKDGARWAR